MLADPVSDGAVRQASVSLLVASGEVGDLGAVEHPPGTLLLFDPLLSHCQQD